MSGAMADDAGLQCPECGYDLRATEAGRCPECGSIFDREMMSRSRVAWEHRHQIGRVRAWWRTVWQATFRAGEIANSISAPADWYAARRFWLINALLLYLPMAAILAVWGEDLRSEASSHVDSLYFLLWQASPWPIDLSIPLAMGFSIPGVLYLLPMGLLLTWTGTQTYLMQTSPLPRVAQDRAATMGLYASGVFVAAMLFTLASSLVIFAMLMAMTKVDVAFISVAFMSPILFFGAAWGSIWRIYRRVARAGVLRSFLTAVAIPAFWLVAGLLWLLVIPWCVGLCALILLSIFQ